MLLLAVCTFLFGWTLPSLQHLTAREYRDTTTPSPRPPSGTELHSSHAPPTRLLSLLLFMHESLSFFLLTNVRASQKCLHLLPSIMHSISSTSYQHISALGHKPTASLEDDSHLTPHIPTFQLHLCLCPTSVCFKQSLQELHTTYEAPSSLNSCKMPALQHLRVSLATPEKGRSCWNKVVWMPLIDGCSLAETRT